MITEDYCSYEVAKLLKEKGFDEMVSSFYSPGDIQRPTHQMAMKWLREVHNLHIQLNWNYANQQYNFEIWKVGKSKPEVYSLDLWHYNHKYSGEWDYEEAVEAALKYCLENLI